MVRGPQPGHRVWWMSMCLDFYVFRYGCVCLSVHSMIHLFLYSRTQFYRHNPKAFSQLGLSIWRGLSIQRRCFHSQLAKQEDRTADGTVNILLSGPPLPVFYTRDHFHIYPLLWLWFCFWYPIPFEGDAHDGFIEMRWFWLSGCDAAC